MNRSKVIFLALLFGGVILEIIGDTLLKKWSMDGQRMLLAAGVLLYAVGSICWILTLKVEGLAKAGSLFTLLNACGLVIIGHFLFGETLSPRTKAGLVLGLVSLILIEF